MRDKMRARTQETADLWIRTIQSDPLHLPRAPVLRHNVSLCHGRSTPLFSPSATPAASAVGSIARVWNPRFWKLGGPNSTSWMQVALVLGEENASERVRETVFQHEFPPLVSNAFPIVRTLLNTSLLSVFWINERIHDATSDESWKYCLFYDAPWHFIRRGSPSGRKNVCVTEIMFYRWLREIDKLWNLRDFCLWQIIDFLTIIKFQR